MTVNPYTFNVLENNVLITTAQHIKLWETELVVCNQYVGKIEEAISVEKVIFNNILVRSHIENQKSGINWYRWDKKSNIVSFTVISGIKM